MKTDHQVQQDVIEELHWEPSIDSTQIGVAVKDGIVTLTGDVSSYAEKWDAEIASQRVDGVRGMAVEINVDLPGSSKRSDTDIARTAENILQWATLLPPDAVMVQVEKGWVTLTGEVAWHYQRQSACNAVRHLMGVTGVSDQIALRPAVSMNAVKADIEVAMKRRAREDAADISVEVKGSDIFLTGRVHTWPERELARHSAWNTPGVCNVHDSITVVN
jgi:osmotically-inducible protein OsmY